MSNNKQFLGQQLLWLSISLGISLAISMLLPFPISLVVIIGVFILINFFMRKRVINKMSGMGMGSGTIFGDNTLKFYCMSCGTRHKESACPKCGSKMKRL